MSQIRRLPETVCFRTAVVLFALVWCAPPSFAQKKGLLLVSIDGMMPDYVLAADKYKLKIPNLRRIAREGAHATQVRSVLPTVTYPAHTTMVTGV
jgi:predicted AlkP superfamily pyrophosphatase or phosphodiesterase